MNLRLLLADEWRQLVSVKRSDRPWEMPVAAALASGLPIFVGVAYGDLWLGLAGSLGGLVFSSSARELNTIHSHGVAVAGAMPTGSPCSLALEGCKLKSALEVAAMYHSKASRGQGALR